MTTLVLDVHEKRASRHKYKNRCYRGMVGFYPDGLNVGITLGIRLYLMLFT